MRVGVYSSLSSSVVRLLTGLGVVGYSGVVPVYGQSPCHHGDDQHGDSDDDDDDGENDDPSDSLSSSLCTPSASWTGSYPSTWSWTTVPSQTASSSAAAVGDNAAVTQTSNKLSSGSIAGVVFGVGAGAGLLGLICYRTRRRYLKKKHIAEKNANAELGNANLGGGFDGSNALATAQPAGTKENAQMMTLGNLAPATTYDQHDIQAYPYVGYYANPHENYTAYTYQRDSTILSYNSPSESTGVTTATQGHGQSNLHEAIRLHQKELEAGYYLPNSGEIDQLHVQNRSDTESASIEPLPEHPPPIYKEH